jgi:hypothetical protein
MRGLAEISTSKVLFGNGHGRSSTHCATTMFPYT